MHRAIKILKPSDYQTTSWKNGGGVTTQIAIYPPEATLDNFLWRLSSAQISQAGPFSKFEGHQRFLAILHGEGLNLKIDDHSKVLRTDDVISFHGKEAASCELLSTEVRDLNLILDRSVYQGSMEICREPKQIRNSGTTLLYAIQGVCRVDCENRHQILHENETLLMESPAQLEIRPQLNSRYAIVRIASSHAD